MMYKKKCERIVFYRNKEMPDYYLLYNGMNRHRPEIFLQKVTHTGDYKDSGYVHLDVELAYILELEKFDEAQTEIFLDFIAKHISSEHFIEHRFYNGQSVRSWLKLESLEPEKWLNDFQEYKNKELSKNTRVIQKTLF